MSQFHFSPRPNRASEIHWHEWGKDAFEQAKAQDKPVLLGISAVWCHWCHVMDETSYSDPNIIQLVNERYVPIRVDNDQRPDVNRRYNLGGWPTTAFLTPEGELLTGGTYIPPDQMRSYLTQVSDAYSNNKEQILQKVADLNTKRQQTMAKRAASQEQLWPDIVDNILNEVVTSFDSRYGGFGDEPKFPQADALELVLEKYYQSRDPSLLRNVTLTLDNMAKGGMYDSIWGGFFRYSTTRDWSVPHYEKMLEDNARLLSLYVHAWQITNSKVYLQTVRSLIAYIDMNLCNRELGGFYGSQDADEKFYSLSIEERSKVPAPFIDRTFYTDWNALMVSAYLAASHLDAAQLLPSIPETAPTGGKRLQEFALKTLDRLWNEMYRPDQGLYHYAPQGENPQLAGQLNDLACTTAAFLDAYQVTGDNIYLQRAENLARLAMDTLLDRATGAFFNELPNSGGIGLLRVADKSMTENALMADALTRLYRLTGDDKYGDIADRALAYFARDYSRYGIMGADYARAVDHLLNEPVSVRIVGQVDDLRTQNLQAAALQDFAPAKIVQVLDPSRDGTRLDQLGYPRRDSPLAYVCVGEKCLAPIGDAAGIHAGMQEIRTA